MTNVSKETLEKIEEYEKATAEYDKWKEKRNELKEELESVLEVGPNYHGRHGTFEIRERKSYNYSDKYDQLNDEIKELRKKEKAEGIAEVEITPTLYYTRN